MEWLLVAVLAKGIVATDLQFDSVAECYAAGADASISARAALGSYSGQTKEDLSPTQYACVLMDR